MNIVQGMTKAEVRKTTVHDTSSFLVRYSTSRRISAVGSSTTTKKQRIRNAEARRTLRIYASTCLLLSASSAPLRFKIELSIGIASHG